MNLENLIFIKLESFVKIVARNKDKRMPIDSRGETEVYYRFIENGWSSKNERKGKTES